MGSRRVLVDGLNCGRDKQDREEGTGSQSREALQVSAGHSRGGNERFRILWDVGRDSCATMLCFASTLQQTLDLRIPNSAKASDDIP